ncbi:hypothetical protein B4144_1842 [Bacillus atrophaeus]|nr:hypothetical protein B4144_1842 [Bacillus atrophaeus]
MARINKNFNHSHHLITAYEQNRLVLVLMSLPKKIRKTPPISRKIKKYMVCPRSRHE